ncbi:hypothetical protein LCGC14_0548820 [marine sediment metagenome]|uniref:Uncharacterized protein n=1 Tax=marine sediment metagenome TaxID=412755 RepID=A0A0F9S973_9ZZZZ
MWLAGTQKPFTQEQIDSIDKNKFCRYEAFRRTGVANMFDIKTVQAFTLLPNVDIHLIICHYDELSKLYHDEEFINHYKECFDDKTSRIQDIFLESI